MASLLLSCSPFDLSMRANKLGGIDPKEKRITFLDDSVYASNMTVALLKYNFDVKPLAFQYAVKRDLTKETAISFDQASARYGIKLVYRPRDLCVFSKATISDFIMSIIDIKANATVLIMEITGPDGECPGLGAGPVWDNFATTISDNWK